MLPISSNTADLGCSPVSSNCVIWQGPDLSCINLCKGDTISDVVYKLATEVCALSGNLGLSNLDLSQLVQVCSTTPEPAKTLAAVLDLLIDKVVCLADIVDGIIPSGATYTEPTLALPACLQYTNAQGQTVTQLIHNQYTLTLATKLCELKGTVDTHTIQIAGLSNRVNVLETTSADALPQISLQCLTGSSSLVDLDVALESVSTELCSLKGVLGSNTGISSAAAKQCTGLSSFTALSQVGTMSSITGWKSTVTTLADSINNLWITVCDMRGALGDLKTTATTVDCSSVIIDFTAVANTARDTITINFNNLTSIPSTFTECTQLGSKITIADSAGIKYNGNIQVVANKANASGVAISLAGAGLNAALNYTVTIEACVSKSGQSCTKTISKTVYAPCTTITINSATVS